MQVIQQCEIYVFMNIDSKAFFIAHFWAVWNAKYSSTTFKINGWNNISPLVWFAWPSVMKLHSRLATLAEHLSCRNFMCVIGLILTFYKTCWTGLMTLPWSVSTESVWLIRFVVISVVVWMETQLQFFERV